MERCLTELEEARLDTLCRKMESAMKVANRLWTDTKDLTPKERAEYRRILDKIDNFNEREQERRVAGYARGQLAAMLGECD